MEQNGAIDYDRILDDYVGGRFICPELLKIYDEEKHFISDPLYRCLYVHKDDVKTGLITQWNGSTHWSYDPDYAKRYLDLDDLGYISDIDTDELMGQNPGMDYDEIIKNFFMPVIMRLDGAFDGMDVVETINKYASENAPVRRFVNEKEVSLIGYDFIITSSAEDNGITLLDVKQKKVADDYLRKMMQPCS